MADSTTPPNVCATPSGTYEVVRATDRDRFVILDRSVVRNRDLSYRARGVLAWVLDQPPGRTITRQVLADNGTEGQAAMRSALAELTTAGFIQRERVRRADGRLVTVTRIYEIPPARTSPPKAGNRPPVASPEAGPPKAGNRPPSSKDLKASNKNTMHGPPAADRVSEVGYPEPFDATWAVYPFKRGAKKAAYRAWRATVLREGGDITGTLKDAVEAYAASVRRDRTEERYVMHGAKFFGPDEHWREHTGRRGSDGVASSPAPFVPEYLRKEGFH